jgi:O-antigen/teichoic acid export membrane protein
MNRYAQLKAKFSRSTHSATKASLKAMSVFGGVRALTILCSLVRNKLIAIWVGPMGVGIVALFNSIMELINSTARLNIDQSAIRDIATKSGDDAAHTAIAVKRWSIFLGSLGSIVMCALSPFLSEWSFGSTDKWWAFCVLSVLSLCYAYVSALSAILQGLRQLSAYARIGIITALIGIVISVPIIYFLREDSIVWVILSYGLASLVGQCCNMPKIAKVKQTVRESWSIGASFVRLGFMMTLAILMGQLFNYLFVLYINKYASTSELGLYQSAFTIINNYVGVIFTGIWVEYFPRMSALSHSPHRMSITISHQIRTTVLILMPVVAVFIALDKYVVELLYNSTFLGALPFLTIGIVSTIPRYVSWCVAYSILAKGDGKMYLISETLSGLIGLVLNVVGYSFFGFAGLGVSYILWYVAYTIIVTVIGRSRYGVTVNRSVWRLSALGLLVGIVAIALKCCVGWWLALIFGIVIAPYALRRLFK